jgi:NAD(P)-dependent dehydrogenase (short-subunit alcohol dehydrogenase family)
MMSELEWESAAHAALERSQPLDGKVIVITGAGGLLGEQHCKAVRKAGGRVVGVDRKSYVEWTGSDGRGRNFPNRCNLRLVGDVTENGTAEGALDLTLEKLGRVDGLINNASINPKVEDGLSGRFEDMSLQEWNDTLAVGLGGAFQFSQVFGKWMHEHGGGVILNVASVLSVVAPDQRLYEGAVKPVTYSVEKHGLIGLTRYLATYWPNVRCNAISPAGVENGQPQEFIDRLCDKIPAGRMAKPDEYKDAVIFCLTQEYLNGHNLVIDGGYSVW